MCNIQCVNFIINVSLFAEQRMVFFLKKKQSKNTPHDVTSYQYMGAQYWSLNSTICTRCHSLVAVWWISSLCFVDFLQLNQGCDYWDTLRLHRGYNVDMFTSFMINQRKGSISVSMAEISLSDWQHRSLKVELFEWQWNCYQIGLLFPILWLHVLLSSVTKQQDLCRNTSLLCLLYSIAKDTDWPCHIELKLESTGFLGTF